MAYIKRYSTDLTDTQWLLLAPHIPKEKDGGRPRSVDVREIVNSLRYMSRTGCQWHLLPNDFPPRSTVYDYFSRWRDDNTLDDICRILRENIRIKAGRTPKPSAAIIDSQTVKNASTCFDTGYDGGKRIKGRKRHIAVDVLGLLLVVIVHSAGIQDRAGSKLVLGELAKWFEIKRVWVDGGYTGPKLANWALTVCRIIIEVVKRPVKKFKIVKWRWIVERTFGWINWHRRLSKDYEYSIESATAWFQLAAIDGMVCRLRPG